MNEEGQIRVDSSDKFRALNSPLRRSFVDALSALGQGSVRDVAERLGKPAATLYYHLKQLEEAGIVRAVSARATGKRPETIYEVVSDYFEVTSPTKDPTWRADVRRHIHSELREVERSLGAYIDDPTFGTQPDVPRLQFRAVRIHLGEEELRELSKRLEELTRFLSDAEKRTGGNTPASKFVFAIAPAHDAD